MKVSTNNDLVIQGILKGFYLDRVKNEPLYFWQYVKNVKTNAFAFADFVQFKQVEPTFKVINKGINIVIEKHYKIAGVRTTTNFYSINSID